MSLCYGYEFFSPHQYDPRMTIHIIFKMMAIDIKKLLTMQKYFHSEQLISFQSLNRLKLMPLFKHNSHRLIFY